ncbi:S-layer homology domain-containing protein [Paenibacillus sp. UNCCL117]|uniref:S-layer homology domain-containing protein n=2 Tax=unclassified Paenibacillus TaxID=185978 RepID=UPI001C43503D|nr:S-layer homology domain-containing protein [Paenibacillus sp. UNCCL117]
MKGLVVTEPDVRLTGLRAELYSEESTGQWKGYLDQDISENFRITTYDAGQYRLVIRAKNALTGENYQTVKMIETISGQLLDAGDFPLGQATIFQGHDGNDFRTLSHEILPGATVTMRGEFNNRTSDDVKLAALQLHVPAGMELLEQSVMLNGIAVHPMKADDGQYELPLGTILQESGGSVTYRLRVNELLPDETVRAVLGIRYAAANAESREETIGTVILRASGVTLTAPQIVPDVVFKVGGRAPASQLVSIYDGEELIGQTEASPGGYWESKVTVRKRGANKRHMLSARAAWGGQVLTSAAKAVEVNGEKPIVTAFSMDQSTVAKIEIDPSLGVAKFPYVIDPKKPLLFRTAFNRGAEVEKVNIHVGAGVLPAELNPETNEFEAVLTSPLPKLDGTISVSYEVKDQGPERIEGSLNDYAELLPQAFHELDVELIEEPAAARKGAAKNRVDLPTVVFRSKKYPDERILVKYSYTPVDYEPAPGVDERTQVFEPSFEMDMKNHTMTFSAIVDTDRLNVSERQAMGLAPEIHGSLSINGKLVFELKTPGAASPLGVISALYSGYDFKQRMDAVNHMLTGIENSAGCMSPPMLDYFRKRLDDMVDRLAFEHSAKIAMQGAGMVLASSGIGLIGGAMLLATSSGVGFMMGKSWEQSFDRLKDEVNQEVAVGEAANPACRADDEDYSYPPPNHTPIGTPVWIYDPSGYVYEAVPSNRLTGVTATISQLNKESGQWEVWDADWFGQQNPMETNLEGRYGWDVPEGTWKVRYEKDGYETAYSEELVVLPPHFDVNIPLVSLESPAVTAAMQSTVNGQTALVLNFSRYMLPETLNASTVQLYSPDYQSGEEPIPIRIEAVDPQQTTENKPLTKAIRLVPEEGYPLSVGQTVSIRVSKDAKSYAEIPLDEDYSESIVISDQVQPVAEAAEALKLTSGVDNLTVKWSKRIGEDVDRYWVEWRTEGSESWYSRSIPKDATIFAADQLAPDTTYEVRLITELAGLRSIGLQGKVKTAAVIKPQPDKSAPGNVTDPKLNVELDSLNVTWKDPDDEDLYRIQLKLKRAGAPERIEHVGTGKEQYKFTSLEPGSYEITLIALDARGNASLGTKLNATISGRDHGGHGNGNGHGGNGNGNGNPPPSDPKSTEVWSIPVHGGEFTAFDGAFKMKAQQGTFGQSTELTVMQEQASVYRWPNNHSPLSPVYTILPAANPQKPLMISLSFDLAAFKGKHPLGIGVYRLEAKGKGNARGSEAKWKFIGGTVDQKTKQVHVPISEGGTIAVGWFDKRFDDIRGHWGQTAIEVMTSRHFLQGFSEDSFAPNRQLTRAEAVQMVVNLLSSPIQESQASLVHPFSDMSEGAWYQEAVNKAARSGWIEGNGGLFRPEDPVTREAFIVMLYRASEAFADYGAEDTGREVSTFADAPHISEWARTALQSAFERGLIEGAGDGKLEPKHPLTRAAAAAILFRLETLSSTVK